MGGRGTSADKSMVQCKTDKTEDNSDSRSEMLQLEDLGWGIWGAVLLLTNQC